MSIGSKGVARRFDIRATFAVRITVEIYQSRLDLLESKKKKKAKSK